MDSKIALLSIPIGILFVVIDYIIYIKRIRNDNNLYNPNIVETYIMMLLLSFIPFIGIVLESIKLIAFVYKYLSELLLYYTDKLINRRNKIR